MGKSAPRGGGGSPRLAEPDRGMTTTRCGKCGGLLYAEKLPESRKKTLWEWSCITCGQTYYPEEGAIDITSRPGPAGILKGAGKHR